MKASTQAVFWEARRSKHSLASELESFLVQGTVQIFPRVGLSPDITLTTCGNINTNKNNFQMRDVCNVFFYWHLCLLIWLKLTINCLLQQGSGRMLGTAKVPVQLCLHPERGMKPMAATSGRPCAIFRGGQGPGTSRKSLVTAKPFGRP